MTLVNFVILTILYISLDVLQKIVTISVLASIVEEMFDSNQRLYKIGI